MKKSKNRRIVLRVDDDLHEAIEAAAERDRRPTSNWICNVLAERLASDTSREAAGRLIARPLA